ncbi:hypothetical protein EV700_1313 [Fluviicoccus keumensis]|uniref:Uncharacterized protein n=1 Tax=Fluviicoccus keumensis TaxID=1435465 RepID=A0A4Q7Z8U0_9GAMM|nr:hypothetical protein [Fluviicoccus keumensis]RZU46927.1 hypothetical protein EV700_1313 [Fluviicoccus keumensis]
MIGYLVAWVVYLTAAIALLVVYKRSFIRMLPSGWRPVSFYLLAVLLLTPWPIDADNWFPSPAVMAVLFNVMERDSVGVMKSVFPLLFLSTLVCSVAWWKSRKAES